MKEILNTIILGRWLYEFGGSKKYDMKYYNRLREDQRRYLEARDND